MLSGMFSLLSRVWAMYMDYRRDEEERFSESNEDWSEFSIRAQPFFVKLSLIKRSVGTCFIPLANIIGVVFPHICDS